MNIGSVIKLIRTERLNLTQEDFAKKVGMSAVYVSRIESGNYNPSINMIEKISKAIDVPVPIIMFMPLEENDINKSKRAHFKIIMPSISELIKTII